MDILEKIVEAKRTRLGQTRRAKPLADLREEAFAIRATATKHRLAAALAPDQINVIAEFKRKSPSKGMIREGISPSEIARRYASGGAAAISVLTEEDFFSGSLEDFSEVRQAVSLPLLRKDFVFDEYQVYESARAGADAMLLIVAALDEPRLRNLRELTEDDLGMDALVEVHTKDEMQLALGSGARLIGVNNRNLKTFEVSLETSRALALDAPKDLILVSESGLESIDDLRRLRELGYSGFLIGESLMRAEKPDEMLRGLIGEQET